MSERNTLAVKIFIWVGLKYFGPELMDSIHLESYGLVKFYDSIDIKKLEESRIKSMKEVLAEQDLHLNLSKTNKAIVKLTYIEDKDIDERLLLYLTLTLREKLMF